MQIKVTSAPTTAVGGVVVFPAEVVQTAHILIGDLPASVAAALAGVPAAPEVGVPAAPEVGIHAVGG